jgi:hypothetical protein
VTAEGEGHVDALRPGCTPLVVEPRGGGAGIRLERDVGQCIAPPEPKRLVERLQRLVEVVRGDRGARRAEKLGEACGVEIGCVALDDVPR